MLMFYNKTIKTSNMDEEIKRLRKELGLKNILKPEDLKPEARGKTVSELIRALREKYG
jgi:hypothetical protein